jgi:hypothetical protein
MTNIGEENSKTQTNIGQGTDRFFLKTSKVPTLIKQFGVKGEFNKSETTFYLYR